MTPKRALIRSLVGLAVLAGLFFARLAVAGYVCSMGFFPVGDELNKVSCVECLNSDHDQPVLCANSHGYGQRWADNNVHPSDGDLPPVAVLLHPRPSPIERWDPLQRLTFSKKASEPIYLKTSRLRL